MKTATGQAAWIALAGLLLVAIGNAALAEEESPLPNWGKELFVRYCSSCHGLDGRGAGPAAEALKTAPTDLTLIRRTHEGKFPFLWVVSFIDGERPVAAHGSREMPIWGQVFRWKEGEYGARAQVYALARYIESIQQQ
jgi:mono/diheme cytochrome c family protein